MKTYNQLFRNLKSEALQWSVAEEKNEILPFKESLAGLKLMKLWVMGASAPLPQLNFISINFIDFHFISFAFISLIEKEANPANSSF